MVKIIGIGGSLRPHSQTYLVLQHALHHAREMGVDAELIDLRTMHLPFCDGGKDYPAFPDVMRFREAVRTSQGIILSTPEYHGSVSGVLKNALDLLEFEHVEGKVFALIGVLGGVSSTNAINTLRTICRHLHAWVIPDQMVIPFAHEAFNEAGEFNDPHLIKKMHELLYSLIDTIERLYRNRG